jgi:hypothetical protein
MKTREGMENIARQAFLDSLIAHPEEDDEGSCTITLDNDVLEANVKARLPEASIRHDGDYIVVSLPPERPLLPPIVRAQLEAAENLPPLPQADDDCEF